jgi:hypothetical protein
MGPAFLLNEVTDEIEWAQCCCQTMLPMIWGGPNVYQNVYCQSLWMGPVLLRSLDADGMG